MNALNCCTSFYHHHHQLQMPAHSNTQFFSADQGTNSVLIHMEQPLFQDSLGNMSLSLEGTSSGGESGWTMYLDQSLEDGCTHTLTGSQEMPSNSKPNEQICMDKEEVEDSSSSMASDASSGPEQPLLSMTPLEGQLCNNILGAVGVSSSMVGRGPPNDDLKLSGYTNNDNDIDPQIMREAKRRKVEADNYLLLLEDTASSPVCSSSSKSGLTENAVFRDLLELSKGFSDSNQADAVNKRLDLLQSILPDAPVCREQTLGVAMEYISALEQRIKTFEGEQDKNNGSLLCAREGLDGECGVLRKRGLCLVPLPTLL